MLALAAWREGYGGGAYGNLVELRHFRARLSLLVAVQLPGLLGETVIEIVSYVCTCGVYVCILVHIYVYTCMFVKTCVLCYIRIYAYQVMYRQSANTPHCHP